MRNYPIPFNEETRIQMVRKVPGLTRENEPVFEAICRAAAAAFGCPLAYITVVEESSQWFKSIVGMDLGEIPKETSFCTHTIMTNSPLVVPDLSGDPRFVDHPMVAEGGPQARFYAGVPLVLSSGYRFGALCVTDMVAHAVTDAQKMEVLKELAQAVVAALERAPAAPAGEPPGSASSTFLTLVGHELRTPLTVMEGALRLIGARSEDPMTQRLAQSAQRSSGHLGTLIETILKFSDAQTGDLRLNESPVMLGALLDSLHMAHGPLLAEGAKRFDPPQCEVHEPVLTDPDQLRICITSLLLNSILHGGEEISLHAGYDVLGNVEISVHDTGRLDSHVVLAELYKPFIVGGTLETRARGGLGLGLPLTRKLVEMHGGEFEVLADAQGTTARIRLPRWRCAEVN